VPIHQPGGFDGRDPPRRDRLPYARIQPSGTTHVDGCLTIAMHMVGANALHAQVDVLTHRYDGARTART